MILWETVTGNAETLRFSLGRVPMQTQQLEKEMPEPLVKMRGITKRVGGVTALLEVNLDAYPGEVLAIVGDNGAGKSTLIKI